MDLIKIENGQLSSESIEYIRNIETQIKLLKEQSDNFKANLLNAMEQSNILKIDDKVNGVHINYIAETERETFDSKKFKEDMPDLYDEYVKFSKVKPNIRVKIDEK